MSKTVARKHINASDAESFTDARGVLFWVHRRETCRPPCSIHSPSEHHMQAWPIVIREDSAALVERICPCGVGHPDPDSLAFLDPDGVRSLGGHGCCGCCSRSCG